MRTVGRVAPSRGTAVLALSLFAVVGATALVPHLMVAMTAAAKTWFMTALPERYTLEFMATIATHPLTVLGIRNSVFLSAVTAMADIVIGIAAAYLLTRWRFVGRSLLDFSVMLPLAVPGLILAFGYVGTFAGTPLDPRLNPFPLLIAAYAVRRLPFMVRSVGAGLSQVDPAMEEASFLLGASRLRTIMRVTLPLVSANIIAGSVLVFTFAMLEVSDSLILAMKENYYPLTKVIYALSLRVADGIPVASALGVLAMAILGAGLVVAGRILGNKMGGLFRM
jgi:iron(III) transport system permease protein